MNLYCKDQKALTKNGQDNWDNIFNTKYVVVKICAGIYRYYKATKNGNEFTTGIDKMKLNLKDIKGIFDCEKDAKEFLESIKGKIL